MNKINYKFNNLDYSFFLRDDVDLSVFNEIFKFREYGFSENKISNAQYPILDIGAHVGFFSLYAYSFNKKVEIYSIEPEKNNLEFLCKHKIENSVENIKIVNKAIGRETEGGELKIEEDSINHVLKTKNQKQKTKTEDHKIKIQKVKILSLKDFLEQNKLERVSLAKIDIEGGEYDIFESLDGETLSKIEAFAIEYHLDVPRAKSQELRRNQYWLENILRESGFSVQIFPSRFDKKLGFIFALNRKN